MGRAAAIILFTGMGWLAVGTIFRVMHWPFALWLRYLGYTFLLVGAFLFVAAAIKNKGITGLMDSKRDDTDPV